MSPYRNLVQQLSTVYPQREAMSMARWVMEDRFGLSQTDLLLDKDSNLSANEVHDLQIITQRLLKKEPLQYVLGSTTFCGLTIHVEPGVLIPRPETAELVQWIDFVVPHGAAVLDIGTGSGCIALALANLGFSVEAWDISGEALRVARGNAEQLALDVRFRQQDILQIETSETVERRFSVIVSNPPYICQREAEDMDANVLEHEPHIALFVPDLDPLLFYRAIARFAQRNLLEDGELFFEINRMYARETIEMLCQYGFEAELRKDQFGNDRMIRARFISPDKD